jgi:hypothetical protein
LQDRENTKIAYTKNTNIIFHTHSNVGSTLNIAVYKNKEKQET